MCVAQLRAPSPNCGFCGFKVRVVCCYAKEVSLRRVPAPRPKIGCWNRKNKVVRGAACARGPALGLAPAACGSAPSGDQNDHGRSRTSFNLVVYVSVTQVMKLHQHHAQHMAAMDKPRRLHVGAPTDRQQRLAAPWRARPCPPTACDAARGHAARTEEHARTQLHQRAPSIFNELEIAQHPKRTAPNGSAPAVQPCRRRRTAPYRSACDPARAASSNRTRRQPTLTIASHIALRRSTSRRHTAQPNRRTASALLRFSL